MKLDIEDPNHVYKFILSKRKTVDYKNNRGNIKLHPNSIDITIHFGFNTIVFWFDFDFEDNNEEGLKEKRFENPKSMNIGDISVFVQRHFSTQHVLDIHPMYEGDMIHVNKIVRAVKETFHRISYTRCGLECEKLVQVLKEFEQEVSPKTRETLKKMVSIRRLNKKRVREYAKKLLKSWKEYYYDPDNENGYVKRLASKYVNM